MKWTYYILTIFLIIGVYSCNKVDRTPPEIESFKINGLELDTIYLGPGILDITYEVSDNEMVVDSKIKIIELANIDSGYFYLNIQKIQLNRYSGSDLVIVPDSVRVDSYKFEVTIDAFDDSGNQAIQKKILVNFK